MILVKWMKWDGEHSSADQQKRLASAKKAECTPISIDKTEESAVFSGSSGVYNTTLDFCTCVDFARRRLPCKHMYRLAIECGLISEDVESDTTAIKAPAPKPAERKQALAKAVEMIEAYDEKIQDEIREMIYYTNAGKLYPCENIVDFEKVIADGLVEVVQDYEQAIRAHTQKYTLEKLEAADFVFPAELKKTKKAHYEWCLANPEIVGPIVYSDFAFLRPAGLLSVAKKKIYTYLLRKFTGDPYVDEEGNFYTIPHGSEMSLIVLDNGESKFCPQFPDDDVTDLLNKYGANRCLDYLA